jgi:tellurite resistance protein TerC
METIGSPALWIGFVVLILVMLGLDLGVFHRKAHEVSLKEALSWSIVWVVLSLSFAVAVYFWFGRERALEYVTGYVIEKALAVDNIFVFVIIFSTFAIPTVHQHRVLFWGIIGALAMRAGFIFAGTAVLQRFHWAIYVLGAALVFTGIKLLVQRDEEVEPEKNFMVKLLRRVVPIKADYKGSHFTVKEGNKRFATPLLLALVVVEVSDVVFALDSIPAIFAITKDPFIVFTSNIFAILGLRSMYFLLASVVKMFVYLKVGLSFVLIFVGVKMAMVDFFKVPIVASLGIIAGILGASIGASILKSNKDEANNKDEGAAKDDAHVEEA